MPSIGQENLETVMIDFFGALRRGDLEAAAGLLDPDVSWQGLREEWVCQGRAEVIDTFRWGLEQRREIDALEFTRGGEQVVLGARGPSIGPAEEPLGQIFNVFTLRDGRIVRIDDYRAAGRRSRQPASPRTRTGADPAAGKRTKVASSRTGWPKRTRGPRSLQRRLEQHAAGAAVRSWQARLTHTDVRVGGWLVEPGTRHSLLAASPQEGDQPLETVWLPAARPVHRCDRSRRSLRARAFSRAQGAG